MFDQLPKAKITRSSKRANLVGKLGKGKQPPKAEKFTNELEQLKKQLIERD